ncbi:hypothetical protein AMTRI_Chr07g28050 [Amborella trichopoda]
MMIAEGMEKIVIIGSMNVLDEFSTFNSLTPQHYVIVLCDGFIAHNLVVVKTVGPTKHHAVALHVQSNFTAFLRLNISFYRDCHIYGTIDFIFGNAVAVF